MGLKLNKNSVFFNKGLAAFLSLYFVFLIAGIIVLISIHHGDVVLWINRYSDEKWDPFVSMLTNFGLGSYVVFLMLLLAFYRVRYTLMGLVNLAIVGIFTNVFKKGLFPDCIRPLNYFLYDDFPRFLYDTELNYHSSFPSGHTMTIFAAMSLLAYWIGNRWGGGLLFFVALIIGFTRIYLLQHFFIDVFVGSVLGIVSTLLVIWLGDGKMGLYKKAAFQKPVYRLSFSKKR